MVGTDARFTGGIPEFYDRHLGPVIFAGYAHEMATRVSAGPASRVLEIAAGTGQVTRELLLALGPDATLTVTDLNDAMLDFARTHTPADPRLQWRAADAQALPFADASFDVVTCQFGFMFVPDKALAFAEAKRLLRPGGRLLLSTWGSLEENDYARIANDTVRALFPTDPPHFYEIPFGWSDQRVILDLLSGAGYRKPRLEWSELDTTSESAQHFATGLVRGNPLALEIAERGTVPIDDVQAAVARALARYGGEAPWRGRLRALFVTASA